MRRSGSVSAARLLGSLVALASVATCAAQNSASPAPPSGDGIAVYGTGETSARPNLVEVDLHLVGRAELTGDALVKHRDAKKRLLEAIDKLGVKNLTSEELSLSISAGSSAEQQQRAMNGMPAGGGKTQIEVTSTIRVRLSAVRDTPDEELIKTVGKLLDVAQDSGVTIGPSPAEVMRNMRFGLNPVPMSPVRFVVSDLVQVREKAYEAAVADARARAGRLARLNQVKLGTALSVQEIQVAGDQQPASKTNVSPYYPWLSGGETQPDDDRSDEPRITSQHLAAMHVQVKLLVRFAIQAPDPATAQQ